MGLKIVKRDLIDRYYSHPAWNQSKLKELKKGLAHYTNYVSKSSEAFLIGSAVDCILLGEKDDFDNQFEVFEEKLIPTVKIKEVIDVLYNNYTTEVTKREYKDITYFPEDVLIDCLDETDYQSNWKNETRIAKIIELGNDYYSFLVKATGKKLLSVEQKERVDKTVESLKTHKYTEYFFNRERLENESFTTYYQLPLYEKYLGLDLKALIDICMVHIDKDNKKILAYIWDLKTTASFTTDFINSFKSYGYGFQLAFYKLLLYQYFQREYTGYKIEIICGNIVESTVTPGLPLTYVVDEEVLTSQLFGETDLTIHDRKVKRGFQGIVSLINDVHYYNEHGWEVPRDVTILNGRIKINKTDVV